MAGLLNGISVREVATQAGTQAKGRGVLRLGFRLAGNRKTTPAFAGASALGVVEVRRWVSVRHRFFPSTNRRARAYRLPGMGATMDAHQADEWLMAQVARGRRDLLEPLLRRYATPLLTFIRRMAG